MNKPDHWRAMMGRAESISAITYTGLPVSGGGAHRMGRVAPITAFHRTLAFIGNCCVNDGITYAGFSSMMRGRYPQFYQQIDEVFGSGSRNSPYRVPVPFDRVEEAVELIDGFRPMPVNEWHWTPYDLAVSVAFRIRIPFTEEPLPGQDQKLWNGFEYEPGQPLGTSGITLTMDNGASLSLNLCLPESPDVDIPETVNWLQENLPIRFSRKHWKRWTPTKNGGFRGRLVPYPEGAAAR